MQFDPAILFPKESLILLYWYSKGPKQNGILFYCILLNHNIEVIFGEINLHSWEEELLGEHLGLKNHPSDILANRSPQPPLGIHAVNCQFKDVINSMNNLPSNSFLLLHEVLIYISIFFNRMFTLNDELKGKTGCSSIRFFQGFYNVINHTQYLYTCQDLLPWSETNSWHTLQI